MRVATADAWMLTAAGEPLTQRSLPMADPDHGEAIVEVIGCGVCHTDLGFADGSVRPNHPLPLILGHEVVGRVVATGAGAEDLLSCEVLVPAVLPCGDCAFCAAGRGNACVQQKMPGNDIHGGFATHLRVPAAPLVRLDGAPAGFDVRQLAVVADAVSTAWQAAVRAEIGPGDAVFVIGAGGGVGGYAVQIARSLGARVIACDVRQGPLDLIKHFGAEETVLMADLSPRDVRKAVQTIARRWDVPSLRWKILECSGHPDGQLAAFAMIGRASTLVQVGFTPRKIELRLSNLMAFDATVHGTWGCPPAAYPAVLQRIYNGDIQIAPFVDYAPLSAVGQILSDMANHSLTKRMILLPHT